MERKLFDRYFQPLRTMHPALARKALLVTTLACLLAGQAPSFGQSGVPGDTISQKFSLQGFGTLGLARSNTDQVEFVRDLSQPDGITDHWSGKIDSLVGIQANFQVSEKIEAVAQAVSHYRYDKTFRPDLTWAFLKYDADSNSSLRAGRLGTEFYMLADSRQVGYSYLTVRPAGDYYGALPFSYIDGLDLQLTSPLANGLIRGKIFSGVSREQAPLADRQWDLDGSRMTGGHIDYLNGHWQWRLGYAQIRFNHNLPISDLTDALNAAAIATGITAASEAANAISVKNRLSQFYSAGVAYDNGPLQVQLMLSETRQESAIFENARSGYLIAGYRIAEVTPFVGYTWVRSRSKSLSTGLPDVGALAVLNATLASTLADSHSDQHTTILGARWDFRRNMALKGQFDHVRGTAQSVFPYRGEKPGFSGNLNVLSFALDFIF